MGAVPMGLPLSSGHMPASQTVAAAAATLAAVSTADPQSSKGTGSRAKGSSLGGLKDGPINPTSQSTAGKDVGAKRPLAESVRPGTGTPRSVRQRVD